MDGGGVHCVVDPGSGWRVLEGLISCYVAELLLKQVVDLVDGEVAIGAEDVEIAGQHQLLVAVAGEATPLEIHRETVRCEKISAGDGFPHICYFKISGESPPQELQGNHPGAVAVDPVSPAPTRWCFMVERLPVEMQDLGLTLVEAPMLTNIGMSESWSVSHSRRSGALSAARGGFLG